MLAQPRRSDGADRRCDGGRRPVTDGAGRDDQCADAADDPQPDRRAAETDVEPTGPQDGPGGREVVVPLRLYKTITVFSTLVAVVTFVFGFVLIDAATLQVSLLRTVIRALLSSVGLAPTAGVLTALLAIAGLTSIAFGTAVYVIGTRFRAQGMGKPQEDSNEEPNDG